MISSLKPSTLLVRLGELEQEEESFLRQLDALDLNSTPMADLQNAQRMIEDFVLHFEECFDSAV